MPTPTETLKTSIAGDGKRPATGGLRNAAPGGILGLLAATLDDATLLSWGVPVGLIAGFPVIVAALVTYLGTCLRNWASLYPNHSFTTLLRVLQIVP